MNKLSKKQKILFIFVIFFIIIFLIYYLFNLNNETFEQFETVEVLNEYENIIYESENISENNNIENKIENKNNQNTLEEKIIVHISGCVKNEGIVELEIDARVKDAINLAGGLTDDADLTEVNLAYKIEDGMKIYIPSCKENRINKSIEVISTNLNTIITKTDTNTSNNEKQKIININTASQTELETLPGIGPSIAMKIIKYREENGKFSSIENLKDVSGVGDVKFENIKKFITT